jgi:hypothetical protein
VAAATLLLGAGLLLANAALRRGAAAALHEAQYRTISRSRTLDSLARAPGTVRPRLERWASETVEAAEREALGAVLACGEAAEDACEGGRIDRGGRRVALGAAAEGTGAFEGGPPVGSRPRSRRRAA